MSWQLASFAIVVAVVLAGFAWYERSRPPSQVVALVAAMAALAIAGRIAFAAFPNVKPTTDIVIFAGYALGGAAGFAVGALTALVSNFWFGQGPWTPWQMAGWGLCGLGGAALALGVRNAGRFTLAAFCGFAAVVYGALLNFSLMATYGGDLSLEHFLVLESRAVPFEAAHAIGNITFALVAGPAMIRMLVRFRERFEWRVPRSAAVASLLLALALVASLPAKAGASGASAASWLVSVQNSDGGFGSSPGEGSNTTTTGWVMLGLEAAGRNPLDVERGGNSPVDYLRAEVGSLGSAGDYARTILALEGAGANPRNLGGRDLVSALANMRRNDGSWEGWPGTTAYAIVAMRAAGANGGLQKSASWLAGAQDKDGGWGDQPNSTSSSDVTGAVLQAIPSSNAANAGLAYLRNHQSRSGGFSIAGSGVNAQSTAWAAQGLIAVGADAGSAIGFMEGLQDADGHYRYSASKDQTPVFVTAQVLVPVSGESLPVAVPPRAPKPVTPTQTTTAPATAPVTPVPIPGVESLPGTATPISPAQSAGPPGGASGPTVGGSGPLVPEAGTAAPPSVSGEPEIEGEGLTQASPAASVDEGDSPSPWVPIGIGLGITALAVALPLLLGKRFAW